MSSFGEEYNERTSGVTKKTIFNSQNQSIISFRVQSECSADEWKEKSAQIVCDILKERDVIVVSKGDQLMDLISDDVRKSHQYYVHVNTTKVKSFVPEPESNIMHYATWVRKLPLEVVEDLVSSPEFIFGNLWFLVPSTNSAQITDDVRQLTPSTFAEFPHLCNEAISSPAMYDGCEILWFNPDKRTALSV
ncbi:uncharacterized protein LOC117229390 [Megalopta genalis]|uniref:uncharacterized protein LOC117229390 n=1 Tax=Megalopta genalis TaxID=115081 RepID=UPI003FD68AAB